MDTETDCDATTISRHQNVTIEMRHEMLQDDLLGNPPWGPCLLPCVSRGQEPDGIAAKRSSADLH
jgi:hypothetical protein